VLVPRVSEFPPLPALCLCVVFLGCGALAILRIDKGIFRCGHPRALCKGGAGFLSQAQALRRSKFTTQTFVGYKTILAK
jgi:hypothetical protein